MSMRKRLGFLIGIPSFVLLVFIISKRNSAPPPVTLVSEEARRNGPCPGEIKTIEEGGKKFKLISNWYACHLQVAGELVYYRYSFTLPPVVRKIVAIPGDTFSVKKDEANRAYNLVVNQKIVQDPNQKPHFFGRAGKDPVLSLYVKGGEGKLQSRQSIVFSDTSPGLYDSGMFGVVNVDDFLGKIETTESK